MARLRRAAEKRGAGNSAPIEPAQMEARRRIRESSRGEVETVEFMGAEWGVILIKFLGMESMKVGENGIRSINPNGLEGGRSLTTRRRHIPTERKFRAALSL